MAINWDSIQEKLPYQKTDEAKAERKQLFKKFDVQGNGYLSLAEVDKGMRDVLHSDELFDCKYAVNAAFHFAKQVSQEPDKHGADFLTFSEFRVFLLSLRQYFEYYQAFDRIDTGDDNRISKEEFCQESVKLVINKWVDEPIVDMEVEFDKIDSNDGGQILFKEFIKWALAKNLDIEGDEGDD